MVLAAPRLAHKTYRVELGLVNPVSRPNVTGCGIMSSVWGMIFQLGSTVKVSVELHVATRHHRVESDVKPEQQPQKFRGHTTKVVSHTSGENLSSGLRPSQTQTCLPSYRY